MFAKVFRSYWYPGHPGFKRIYKPHFLSKRSTITELNYITDPIDKRNIRGPIDTFDGEENSVLTIYKRLKFRQNLNISAATAAYMAYNGALTNLTDDDLWKEIDFYIMVKINDMDARMIFGCMYGLMKVGKGKINVLQSIITEFNKKVKSTLKPYEIFLIVEACCLNPGDKFDAVNYMHEEMMPLFKENFRKCRFLHIESYLLKLINYLSNAEYFEPWIWEKISEIIKKKKFGDIDTWEVFYKKLHELNAEEIRTCAGVDINELIEHFENIWHRHPDYKWKYNLGEKRFFTIDEMIDRVKDSPNQITWQEGEEMIKHNLPKWYWDYDMNLKDEYVDLYDEYLQNTKNS